MALIDVNYKKLQSKKPEFDYTILFRWHADNTLSVETITNDNLFVPSLISYSSNNTNKIVNITKQGQLILYKSVPRVYNILIPKQIVCTWKTKEIEGTPLEYPIRVMKAQNPGYTITIFDDNDCREFIATHFDERVLKAYDSLIPAAFKADLWRYCYLFIHGGIYLDIKTICNKSFDHILHNRELFLVKDIEESHLYNGVIATIKSHPLIKAAIDQSVNKISNREYGRNYLDITGPALFGSVFNLWLQRSPNTPIKLDILHDKIKWCYLHTTNHNYINDIHNNLAFHRFFSSYYSHVNINHKHYSTYWVERGVYKDSN